MLPLFAALHEATTSSAKTLERAHETTVLVRDTCVTLNAEESSTLVEDIVRRVSRQDASVKVVSTVAAKVDEQRRLMRQRSIALMSSFSVVDIGRSSVAMSPRRGARLTQMKRNDPKTFLLFPWVCHRLLCSLKRARLRLSARTNSLLEDVAVEMQKRFAKRHVWSRWVRMHHVHNVGLRSSLNRILKKWKAFVVNRNKLRQLCYSRLFHAVDSFRLHRALCCWYVYGIAERATAAEQDPRAAILRRPCIQSLMHRRPDIVYGALDSVLKTQVKEERMAMALQHHQTRTTRPAWDSWRQYVFQRRVKRNHAQMVHVHLNLVVKGRSMQQCFKKWRFRMGSSRSLSVYLFRLQHRVIAHWRCQAEQALRDADLVRLAKHRASKITVRICMQHWRRRTNETSMLTLLGTVRALNNAPTLLPFAFVLEGMSRNGGTDDLAQLSCNRAAQCCRCFQQWKRYWQRRRTYTRVVRQQHRLYCTLLLKKAFFVWRTQDMSWEMPSHVSSYVDGGIAAEAALLALHGKTETVTPVVQLFGPEPENVMLPWHSLRGVERHCRRSYTSFGTLQSISSFQPKSFFVCDTSLVSSKCALSHNRLEKMDADIFTPGATQRRQSRAAESLKPDANLAGFYSFLRRRVSQAVFVLGRIIIASRHASQQLNTFRDLMFSKHVALSRERIQEVQETLDSAAAAFSTSPKTTRFRKDRLAVTTGATPLFLEHNRCKYTIEGLDAWIAQRDLSVALFDTRTEYEVTVSQFASVLSEKREELCRAHKRRLLSECPTEILSLLSRLGFPPLSRTAVEERLAEIASFLNDQILLNIAHRVAFRMRRAFTLSRWAVAGAADAYWSACSVRRDVMPPPAPPPSKKRPRRRQASSVPAVITPIKSAPPIRRQKSASAPLSALFKQRSLSAELLAVEVAVAWRQWCVVKNTPEAFLPTSVVCLVPAKVIVQTIVRSQNAPDKIVVNAMSAAL